LKAEADWSACLWNVLMFQSWLDARRGGASGQVQPSASNAMPRDVVSVR
jgi:hypothetical protein